MKKTAMLGLALALVPAAAFAQSSTAVAPHTAAAPGVATRTAAATVSRADMDFATNAAIGGMAEVLAGQLAVGHGSGDAKTIGQQMVTDHTRLNEELTSVAKAKGLDLPKQLDELHTAMIKDLTNTTAGRPFDNKYLTSQVTEHLKAIALFQQEADHGTDPDLKALAAKALPILKHHLDLVQAAVAKQS